MSRTDALLSVEERMTEEERAKFLTRMVYERNPHLRGALVADVLDMLYEQDAFLGIVEPFYEDNRALWDAQEDQDGRMALSYAAAAAVVLLEVEEAASNPPLKDPPPEMLALVTRLAGVGG